MIPGRATAEGTARFRQRFEGVVAAGHFRRAPRLGELWLSSIGLGTYLGAADGATDQAYEAAVLEALRLGCNVFDTAINYRYQRSERALGRALRRAFEQGLAARDEVFVSTKAGFLPFDGDRPEDPKEYLRREYLDSGLLEAADLAPGPHALEPRFLDHQLERSRQNLGLAAVDLFYLHNPESQLTPPADETTGWQRLNRALKWAADRAAAGEVTGFGLATWNGLRSTPGEAGHLALERLQPQPRSFAALQAPFNLAMPEALAAPTQELDGVHLPLLVAARMLGLTVFTSASILQGRFSGAVHERFREVFSGLSSDAQRALQFARSAPGVTTALVGMSRREHVRENLEVAAQEPASPDAFQQLFLPG